MRECVCVRMCVCERERNVLYLEPTVRGEGHLNWKEERDEGRGRKREEGRGREK